MNKKYLTTEEQFKETLNNEEISRIEDQELKEIRSMHWSYRQKIFLDEHGISDEEFSRLTEEDYAREKKELEEYKKRRNIDVEN